MPVTQSKQTEMCIRDSKSVIDKYFTNTVSRIGGITLQDIENDVDELHSAAYDPVSYTHLDVYKRQG